MEKLIKKLEKQTNLSKDSISGIMAYNHYLQAFKPKLVDLDVTLNDSSIKVVNKLSKQLKVDRDAVLGYIIYQHLLATRTSCPQPSENECGKNLTKPSTKQTTLPQGKRPKKS